jgi:Plasmid recombination enzyme
VLRAKKLAGAGIIRAAAAHNKRTIAAELGAGAGIDASRCALNECLAGPALPDEVAESARAKMAAAGIGKLRKDAVRAVEFVVSLAPGQCADERAFFEHAMHWLAGRFGGTENILCADIHRDEASPHLHLLLLPLIGGRMVGSDALGGPSQLRKLHSEFFDAVCAPYGLKRYPRRLTGASKAAAAASVLAELRRRRDACLTSALWPVLRGCIETDPSAYAVALGVDLAGCAKRKKLRSMTAVFISKGKGSNTPEPSENPIRFAPQPTREPYAL